MAKFLDTTTKPFFHMCTCEFSKIELNSSSNNYTRNSSAAL